MTFRQRVAKAMGQKTVAAIAIAIILATAVGIVLYVLLAATFFGAKDLRRTVVDGLFFEFTGIALLMLITPTAVHLFREDTAKSSPGLESAPPPEAVKPNSSPDAAFWLTRMRTIVTVALSIVLLVFAITWFVEPSQLQVVNPAPGSGGGNATGNGTVVLSPFVKAFFDVYVIVIAFYFTTAAAESIATIAKKTDTPPK